VIRLPHAYSPGGLPSRTPNTVTPAQAGVHVSFYTGYFAEFVRWLQRGSEAYQGPFRHIRGSRPSSGWRQWDSAASGAHSGGWLGLAKQSDRGWARILRCSNKNGAFRVGGGGSNSKRLDAPLIRYSIGVQVRPVTAERY